eukprot:12412566-Karenia_brevis.AAC.1
MLYGSRAWVMTADRERKLRSTQRRMLRIIVKVGRRIVTNRTEEGQEQTADFESLSQGNTDEESSADESSSVEPELENYVDWIRRATGVAESAMSKASLEDWVTTQRRWKWKWAGHAARRKDH